MLYKNLAINQQNHLTFAGYDTIALAEKYGTPLLLMDERLVRERCREYVHAMRDYLPAGSRPSYASRP